MADVPPEKSLDDFFAKRDKKKKKEKGKGKESAVVPASAAMKKTKKEKEKSAKNENPDAQVEKVTFFSLTHRRCKNEASVALESVKLCARGGEALVLACNIIVDQRHGWILGHADGQERPLPSIWQPAR